MDTSSKKLQRQQELQRKSTDISLAQASSWDKSWIDRKKDKSKITTSSTISFGSVSNKNSDSSAQAQHQTKKKQKENFKIENKQKKSSTNNNSNNKSFLSDQSGESEYEVEKIIDKKTEHGKQLYKVKWKGWDYNSCTWEPAENLENVWDLIDEFEESRRLSDKKRGVSSKSQRPRITNIEDEDEVIGVTGELDENSEEFHQIENQPKGNQQIVKGKTINSSSKQQDSTSQYSSGSVFKQSKNAPLIMLDSKNSNQLSKKDEKNYKISIIDNPKEVSEFEPSVQKKHQAMQPFSSSTKISMKSQELQHASTTQSSSNPKQSSMASLPQNSNLQGASGNSTLVNPSKKQKEECQSEKNMVELETDTQEDNEELVIECFFEAILDKKQLPGEEPQYLIKFCDVEEPAWEYLSNLENLQEEIEEFEQKLKEKQKNQNLDTLSRRGEHSQLNQDRQEAKSGAQSVELKNTQDRSPSVNYPTQPPNDDSFEMEEDVAERQYEDEAVEEEQDDEDNAENQVEEEQVEVEMHEEEKDTKSVIHQNVSSKSKTSLPREQSEQEKPPKQRSNSDGNINKLLNNISTEKNILSTNEPNRKHRRNSSVDQNQKNQLSNLSNLTETGCYFKGDKSEYVTLVDENPSDIFKSSFKVFWKPRSNNVVPQPSIFSYQLIKEIDSKSIVEFFEKIYEKQRTEHKLK